MEVYLILVLTALKYTQQHNGKILASLKMLVCLKTGVIYKEEN